MKPPVGSMMPVMQTRPPARPMISREISSLWPLPKVWITPPRAMQAARAGAARAMTGALAFQVSASILLERSR
jgi:hypothetical protein